MILRSASVVQVLPVAVWKPALIDSVRMQKLFPVASSGVAPSQSVDVGINAVIVSGARTPWEAIGKGPGVRNVTVTGGIIALGETALAKPPSHGSNCRYCG